MKCSFHTALPSSRQTLVFCGGCPSTWILTYTSEDLPGPFFGIKASMTADTDPIKTLNLLMKTHGLLYSRFDHSLHGGIVQDSWTTSFRVMVVLVRIRERRTHLPADSNGDIDKWVCAKCRVVMHRAQARAPQVKIARLPVQLPPRYSTATQCT